MSFFCKILGHKYHSWVSASKWVVGDERCTRCGESYKEEVPSYNTYILP